MHVPVNDEDPFEAEYLLSVASAHRDIVENAEAPSPFVRCVMPWRPNGREAVRDRPTQDRVSQSEGTGGGHERHIEGVFPDNGITAIEPKTRILGRQAHFSHELR